MTSPSAPVCLLILAQLIHLRHGPILSDHLSPVESKGLRRENDQKQITLRLACYLRRAHGYHWRSRFWPNVLHIDPSGNEGRTTFQLHRTRVTGDGEFHRIPRDGYHWRISCRTFRATNCNHTGFGLDGRHNDSNRFGQ